MHSPVFLVNSCLDRFSAPRSHEDPLSRSYGVSLPSSLAMNLPSALVYSTRPRVSVYGTGDRALKLSGFSREPGYRHCRIAPGGAPYYRASALRVCFTARIYAFALQPPIPSGGGRVTSPSPHRTRVSSGILTASSIGLALRLILRTRLTLNRLTLFRKPWSFGEGASHPLYRYLYLHLLFHALQKGSSPYLRRSMECSPTNHISDSEASATGLIPDYYPRPVPRPVSCYALFE